jgi:hypothetical protein
MAAVVCALPMMAVPNTQRRYLLVIAFVIGTNWFLWLIGAAAIILRKRRSPVRRIEFQVVGAAIAFVHPLAAVIAIQYALPLLFPDIGHSARPVETTAMACLLLGLPEIPFGLLAAWILWRLGFPPLAAAFAAGFAFSSRRWEHVRRARLHVFLLLAPMPAAMAMAVFFIVSLYIGPFSGFPPEFLRAAPAWIFSIAAGLALFGGAIFVGLSRLQEMVTRGNCLLFGAATSFTLPGTWAIVSATNRTVLGGGPAAIDAFVSGSPIADPAFFCLVGTLLVPFGLLGGWLLWQAGVAPSPNPVPIAAAEAAFE